MAKKSFNFRQTKGLGNLRTVLTPKDITILPELNSLIPKTTLDERILLKESIEKDGIKEKLELWEFEGKSILVDGHNRLEILQEMGESNVPHVFKEFSTIEEVKDYMLRKQLGRRNLSDANRVYLIGLLYNDQKGRQGGATENKENVAQSLASSNAISERSVRNAGNYAKGVDKLIPEDKKAVLEGEKQVPKADLEEIGKDKSIQKPISVEKAKEKINATRTKKSAAKSQTKKIDEEEIPAGEQLKDRLFRDLEFLKGKYGEELFYETIINFPTK